MENYETLAHAIRGDIIRIHDIPKFKRQYANATAEVMTWHPGDLYTVLVNGMPILVSGYEFTIIYGDNFQDRNGAIHCGACGQVFGKDDNCGCKPF